MELRLRKKHKLKCHGDLYYSSQGFAWIKISCSVGRILGSLFLGSVSSSQIGFRVPERAAKGAQRAAATCQVRGI